MIIGMIDCCTDTDRERNRSIIGHKWSTLNGDAQALGDLSGGVDVGFRERHRKFFAAVATDSITRNWLRQRSATPRNT